MSKTQFKSYVQIGREFSFIPPTNPAGYWKYLKLILKESKLKKKQFYGKGFMPAIECKSSYIPTENWQTGE